MTGGARKLAVKAIAGAAGDGVQGWLGDVLKVRVRAAPERGRANAAVLEVLAQALEVPRTSVRIVAGWTSPRKIVEIDGLEEAEIRRRLDRPE